MKFKIISDGTHDGTRIVERETEEEIEGIVAFAVSLGQRDEEALLRVEIRGIEIDVEAEGNVQEVPDSQAR